MSYLRDNSNLVKGDQLWLFLGTEEGFEVPTCFSQQHSLNRSLSTTAVSSKDHGNTSYVVPGEGSWTCSTEALMSMTTTDTNSMAFVEVMDAYDKSDKVYVKFGKLSNYVEKGIVNVDTTKLPEGTREGWKLDTPYWKGEGYITSLQASGGHGDSATFSIEITGIGPLTKVTEPEPTPEDYDISMSYVGGTETSSAELEANIVPNQYTASSGEDVTIIPTDVTDKKYFAPYISCTANNGTPEWDMEHKYWKLTMPDDDATITLSDTTKYRALVNASSRSFDYKGIYGEYRTKFPAGSYAYIIPTDEDVIFNPGAFICQASYIAGGTTVQFEPYWNSSYAYWYFTMPEYDVTSYIYHYNDVLPIE